MFRHVRGNFSVVKHRELRFLLFERNRSQDLRGFQCYLASVFNLWAQNG